MLNEVPTPCHVTDNDGPVAYEIIPAAKNSSKGNYISLLNYCPSNTGFTEMIQKGE